MPVKVVKAKGIKRSTKSSSRVAKGARVIKSPKKKK